MTYLQILHIISFTVCLVFITVLLTNDFRAKLNRIFSCLVACFAIWCLGKLFLHTPDLPAERTHFFLNFLIVGAWSFSGFYLWFVLVLTEHYELLNKKYFLPALFIVPAVIIVQQWVNRSVVDYLLKPYGWVTHWQNTIWSKLLFFYIACCVGYSFYLLFVFLRRTSTLSRKKLARAILVVSLAPWILGYLSCVILPVAKVTSVPDLGQDTVILWGTALVYCILRYRLFTITPATAAENILATINDCIIFADNRLNIVRVNQAVTAASGYEPHEIEGKPLELLFNDKLFIKMVTARLITGAPLKSHYVLLQTKKGAAISMSFSSSLLRDENGDIAGIVCVVRDITERLQAVETLNEIEGKYRNLVELASDGIVIIQDGLIKYANPQIQEITGYSFAENANTPFTSYILPEDKERIQDIYKRRMAGEKLSSRYDICLKHKDGRRVCVEVSSALIVYNGRPADLVIMRDVTRSREADAVLRESERRYKTLVGTIPDVIYEVDEQGNFIFVSKAIEQFGYNANELLGHDFKDIVNPEDHENVDRGRILPKMAGKITGDAGAPKLFDERRTGDRMTRNLMVRLRLKNCKPDGGPDYSFVELHSSGEWDKDVMSKEKKFLGSIGVIRNVNERKMVEDRLKESEDKYRNLVEQANDGIVILQDDFFKYANTSFLDMIGYSGQDLMDKSFSMCVHPEELPRPVQKQARKDFVGEITPVYEAAIRHKDGSKIYVEFSSGDITYHGRPAQLIIIRDITERKRLQEQLIQSQKMEIVGRLAGGVAHDFNNLLTAILNFAILARDELPAVSSIREDIEQIVAVAQRAGKIVHQLLAFSRRQVMRLEVVNIDELVFNMNKILRRFIREDIEIVIIPSGESSLVKIDVAHIEQVIINIVLNARDAMPTGGKVIIKTGTAFLNEERAAKYLDVASGRYVTLAVTDSGVGISDEVKKHLFEPFFTTKKIGEGTGLGLCTAYGIVKQHHGHIAADSDLGHGATFTIYLPYATVRRELSPEETGRPTIGGNETILLVEDEPAVRVVTGRILRNLGYKVIEASEGSEALKLVQGSNVPIQLLLTDVVMPQLNGKVLAEKIKDLRVGIKILFVSGYADNILVQHGFIEDRAEFLQKPFTDRELAFKVRSVLDQKK